MQGGVTEAGLRLVRLRSSIGSRYGSGKIEAQARADHPRAHIASLHETVVAIWHVQLFSKLMVFFSNKESRWHSCSQTGKLGFSIRTTPRSQSRLRNLWRASVGLTFSCVPMAGHRRVLEPGHSVGIQSSILASFSVGFLTLPPTVLPQYLPFLLRS